MKFRELAIGDRFDFNEPGGEWRSSFSLDCQKVSVRCYVDTEQHRHQVGTINVEVYHVRPVAP